MRHWFSRRCAERPALQTTPLPQTRILLADALHIFVLTSFAVAQPLYDRLGERCAFLVDQNVTLPAVCLLVVLLSLGIPAAIVLCEFTASRCGRRIREALHAAIVFVLLVLLALPVSSRVTFLAGWSMLGLSLAAGCVVCWGYFEFRRMRALLSFAAPGVIIFPAVFLAQFATATATIGSSRMATA